MVATALTAGLQSQLDRMADMLLTEVTAAHPFARFWLMSSPVPTEATVPTDLMVDAMDGYCLIADATDQKPQ